MSMKGGGCMGKLTEIDVLEAIRALNIEVSDEVSMGVDGNIDLISAHYEVVSAVLSSHKAEGEDTKCS